MGGQPPMDGWTVPNVCYLVVFPPFLVVFHPIWALFGHIWPYLAIFSKKIDKKWPKWQNGQRQAVAPKELEKSAEITLISALFCHFSQNCQNPR